MKIKILLLFVSIPCLLKAQPITISGNQYHQYGPNTSWGAYLQVGGNGRVTNFASVAATNGNLHLDSKSGHHTYLNYYSLGNTLLNTQGGIVGVGTSAPDPNSGLHMYQDRYTLYGPNTTWSAYLQVGGNGRTTNYASVVATNGNLHLDSEEGHHLYLNHYSMGNTFLNPQGGNVGIGTTNPYSILEVSATSTTWGEGIIVNPAPNNFGAIFFRETSGTLTGSWSVGKLSSDNFSVLRQGLTDMTGTSREDSPLEIDYLNGNTLFGGNVGIGTTEPDAKLTVKGDIHTQEVTVDLQGAVTPDFVFEEDYVLQSLEDTEEYIQANKHLPEIPSASEMEENGFKLKEMDLKLLQKVEELTLHLIQQNKKIKNLEEKMAKMEAEK